MDSITIDLPGKFVDYFSLTDVGQGNTDQKATGYPGAPGLFAAYEASEVIKRGKGVTFRLTIPVDEHTADVLNCLWKYADTCDWVNRDEPETRGEMNAGRTVRARVEAARQKL